MVVEGSMGGVGGNSGPATTAIHYGIIISADTKHSGHPHHSLAAGKNTKWQADGSYTASCLFIATCLTRPVFRLLDGSAILWYFAPIAEATTHGCEHRLSTQDES